MPEATTQAIEALFAEHRAFPPSDDFKRHANWNDPAIYDLASQDYEAFWATQAERLDWFSRWKKVLQWDDKTKTARWFDGGTLNVSYNCLDRHVKSGHGKQVAFYWEGEPGDTRALSFADLLAETCRLANALKELGVKKGDRVAIYMGMVPELTAALLACARIGAIHSVVFGGFSADSLRDRINDGECKVLITQDQGWRRGGKIQLKQIADDAIKETPCIESCIVLKRVGDPVEMKSGRDHWYHELVARQSDQCEPQRMDAEDELYILYSSGTTAKPKGIVHTTGGYLTGIASTHKYIFDIKEDKDIYWCTADIGWVTGHSYIVYGPLANRTTGVIYEGTPDFPDKDRFWAIVEKYKISVMYTAPTAIRTFMKWGPQYPEKHDLSSLRLLGSVGEPINPEAWVWYYEYIGRGKCPVVDTWWQTETGMILVTPLPGITPAKPGSATFPYPGVFADVVDNEGNSVPLGGGGYIVITKPWPAMLRTLWRSHDRYLQTYWSRFQKQGYYFPADGCKRDEDGYYWLLGRVDDVMNVSGHRISTTEVESAFVDHPKVAEAAVVSKKDDITGEAIAAFVTLKGGGIGSEDEANELRKHVASKIGAFARPKYITFTPDLPKTRSGKIMRRLLRDVMEDRPLGDTTTLADATVVKNIADLARSAPKEE
ncbi:MAG: acetate--CoA ligase [Candidatus Eremiobacteraeota bacterium]|nr:acetate--CoA ligase [Candidatus Eremiobacteraeota bacterium]MBV8366701.1 acetate--CoA ligase [Candidatus Eremiobacteraeota bacterium]